MKDEATRASEAPLPETIEGLRRQNSAYRSLCASLEAQMSILTEKGREYQEAVNTLDSEREANAILTDEIAALRAENARLTKQVANLEARGIHSCNDECQRPLCVAQRENARLREALVAIRQRGIERDVKWAGMNAHDIARAALKQQPD